MSVNFRKILYMHFLGLTVNAFSASSSSSHLLNLDDARILYTPYNQNPSGPSINRLSSSITPYCVPAQNLNQGALRENLSILDQDILGLTTFTSSQYYQGYDDTTLQQSSSYRPMYHHEQANENSGKTVSSDFFGSDVEAFVNQELMKTSNPDLNESVFFALSLTQQLALQEVIESEVFKQYKDAAQKNCRYTPKDKEVNFLKSKIELTFISKLKNAFKEDSSSATALSRILDRIRPSRLKKNDPNKSTLLKKNEFSIIKFKEESEIDSSFQQQFILLRDNQLMQRYVAVTHQEKINSSSEEKKQLLIHYNALKNAVRSQGLVFKWDKFLTNTGNIQNIMKEMKRACKKPSLKIVIQDEESVSQAESEDEGSASEDGTEVAIFQKPSLDQNAIESKTPEQMLKDSLRDLNDEDRAQISGFWDYMKSKEKDLTSNQRLIIVSPSIILE